MLNEDGKFVSTRPWKTKEWRDMRNDLIKDYCEQCGSTKEPFVLHHIKGHSYSWINKKVLIRRMFNDYLPSHVDKDDLKDVERCPKCSKASLSKRKTKYPIYRCSSCYHEFDTPKIVSEVKKIGKERYKKIFKDFLEEKKEEIEETFLKECKESQDKYMSGEDTKTFCRKCAYLWDIKHLSLCPKCKKEYKPLRFEFCYECYKIANKDFYSDNR